MHNNEKLNDVKKPMSKLKFYTGTVALGVARTTLGFPFEHPIDSIKTQW